MNAPELESFMRKFHQLWKAGSTAHLDLDCHAGYAWIGLRVQLGPAHGPANQAPLPRYRGPSYKRRQERRRAARAAAPANSQTTAEVSENVVDAEKVDTQQENIENVVPEEEQNVASTEKVNVFTCNICAFQSKWENGLKIHTARKHKNIVQVDGCDDIMDENDAYESSIGYWETGEVGMAYYTYLDAVKVIENSELSEDDKIVEKTKVTEARKQAFGSNYKYYPPWKYKDL